MSTITDDLNKRIRTGAKLHQKMLVRNFIDIYRDRWLHIIEDELSRQFSPEEYSKMYWLRTQELNLLKRVVNDLSLVYMSPAKRNLYYDGETETTADPKSEKLYKEITSGIKKDVILKQVNRYTNLCNHTVLKVGYKNGLLDYDILLFDNVEVYMSRTDWSKVACIKYYSGLELPVDYSAFSTKDPANLKRKGDSSDLWQLNSGSVQQYSRAVVWCAENMSSEGIIENGGITQLHAGKVYYLSCSKDSEIIEETKDNEYRDTDGNIVLPFVFFDKTFPIDCRFDFSSGNDLRDMTIAAAIMLVHLNELLKYQSYKMLAITVQDRNKLPPNMKVGPTQTLVLESGIEGGSASASVLDLQANITSLLDFCQKRINMCLAGYGVSPENFSMSGQAQSGLALQISNMGKIEARKDQVDIYRLAENELFNIERIVYNYHAVQSNKPLLDVKLKFSVDFEEPSFPRDKAEEASWLTFLKQNNAITDIDIIMGENPDLTKEEAMAVYNQNKAMNTSAPYTMQPLATPTVENEDDTEDEQEDEIENV